MGKEPLFPELPDDLADLNDEDLQAALDKHLEVGAKIDARDEEIMAEYASSPDELVTAYTDAAVAAEKIRAEQGARVEAAAEAEAKLAEASAKLRAATGEPDEVKAEGEEPEPEEPSEPSEPSDPEVAEVVAEAEAATAEAADAPAEAPAEAELEPVAASAKPKRQYRLPAPSPDRQLVADAQEAMALTAAAGIKGINPGQALDRETLGRALVEAWSTTHVQPGVRADVVVASGRYDYPDTRRLGEAWETEGAKVMKAFDDEEAVLASGGICATPTPIYDFDILSVDDRPVRSALSPFQAVRGGVNVPAPLTLADVTTAVGHVTAEDDAEGGSLATKTCQELECGDPTDYFVEAVYACVKWGNFGARTWPERVTAFAELVRSAHSRLADGLLLTKIQDLSTAVTAAQLTYGYGATSSLLNQILVGGDSFRSRHRMDPMERLTAIFPFWVKGLLVGDLRNGMYDRFEYSIAGVQALLNEHGIDVSFHLDQAEGTAQIFGAQTDGALLTYPNVVHWALFPRRTFIFLDQGTLDLGIVRDSTLMETNDFKVFYESFEGLAMLGAESYWIESTLCNTGSYAPAGSLLTCA